MEVPGSLHQDPFGALVSGSCRTSCARSLCQDLCIGSFVDILKPLVHDTCLRASASGSIRSTCIRILEGLLCKISVSGSLRILWKPDLCIGILWDHLWISCARSLCQDLCIRIVRIRILFGALVSGSSCARCLCQDPFGALVNFVQNLCVRIFACQNLCISRHQGPLGELSQDPVGPFAQGSLHQGCWEPLVEGLPLSLRISASRSLWRTCVSFRFQRFPQDL